jgi:fatty acid synthase, animal type
MSSQPPSYSNPDSRAIGIIGAYFFVLRPSACSSDDTSIGLSISAPGGEVHGLDTEAFYEFLKRRGSGIITVPADRWNAEAFHGTAPGKICTVSPYSVPFPSYELTRWMQTKGGFIPDFSHADLQEFGITPAEGSQVAFSQFVL